MARSARRTTNRRHLDRQSAPLLGIILVACWGLAHLFLAGSITGAAAGNEAARGLLRLTWVAEGLFLLSWALIGLVFARPLLSREPSAVRLYKMMALGLLVVAAWHHLGPTPTGFFGQVYSTVLVVAAALMLVPLYLAGATVRRRNEGFRRRATDGETAARTVMR